MTNLEQYGHLPVEELADHAEGLVAEDARLAAVRTHLAGCAQCQGVVSDLAEVRAVLAADAVGPMPAAVTARLVDAIAAEARGGETAGGDAVAVGGTAARGSHPMSGRRDRRTRTRAASALAAAATIAAFVVGAAVLTQGQLGDNDSGAAGMPAAAPGAEGFTRHDAEEDAGGQSTVTIDQLYFGRSDQEYSSYTLSIAARQLLANRAEAISRREVSAGGARYDGLAPPGPAPAFNGTSSDPATTGGTTPPRVQVQRLKATTLHPQLSSVLAPEGLARCLASITTDPAAVTVLAMDVGRYDGQPALLLVLSDPQDPTKAQVRLVGNSCGLGVGPEFLRTEIRR